MHTKPNVSYQTRKLVRPLLKISSSCWNPSSQDRAVGHIVDIRKQNDLEEEEPEPESTERAVTSFEADWKGLDWQVDIKVLEDTDWNERPGTATRRGIRRILASCEEILKVERELSNQISVLAFFNWCLGVVASPPVLLDTG